MTREFALVTKRELDPSTGRDKEVLLNPGAMQLLIDISFEAEDAWLQSAALQQLVKLYGAQVVVCCRSVGLGRLMPRLRLLPAELYPTFLGVVHSIWVDFAQLFGTDNQPICCFEEMLALVEASPHDRASVLVMATLASLVEDSGSLVACQEIAKVGGPDRLLALLQLLLPAPIDSSGAYGSILKCIEVIAVVDLPSCTQLMESQLLLTLSRLLDVPELPPAIATQSMSVLHTVAAASSHGSWEPSLVWTKCAIRFALRNALHRLLASQDDLCAQQLISSTTSFLNQNSRSQAAFWTGRSDLLLHKLLQSCLSAETAEMMFGLISALISKNPASPLLYPEGPEYVQIVEALKASKVLGDGCDSELQHVFVSCMMGPPSNQAINSTLFVVHVMSLLRAEEQTGAMTCHAAVFTLAAGIVAQLISWADEGLYNLQLLTSVPMFSALLKWASQGTCSDEVLSKAVELMSMLASHRLSQPELYELLAAARSNRRIFAPLLRDLMTSGTPCYPSLVFEGSDAYMRFSAVADCLWPSNEGLSIICWCRTPASGSTSASSQVLKLVSVSSAGVCFEIQLDGSMLSAVIKFSESNGERRPGTVVAKFDNTSIPADQWVNLVVIHEVENQVKLFVDGVGVSQVNADYLPATAASSVEVSFGGMVAGRSESSQVSPNKLFSWQLGACLVYNQMVSSAQVKFLFNNGPERLCVLSPLSSGSGDNEQCVLYRNALVVAVDADSRCMADGHVHCVNIAAKNGQPLAPLAPGNIYAIKPLNIHSLLQRAMSLDLVLELAVTAENSEDLVLVMQALEQSVRKSEVHQSWMNDSGGYILLAAFLSSHPSLFTAEVSDCAGRMANLHHSTVVNLLIPCTDPSARTPDCHMMQLSHLSKVAVGPLCNSNESKAEQHLRYAILNFALEFVLRASPNLLHPAMEVIVQIVLTSRSAQEHSRLMAAVFASLSTPPKQTPDGTFAAAVLRSFHRLFSNGNTHAVTRSNLMQTLDQNKLLALLVPSLPAQVKLAALALLALFFVADAEFARQFRSSEVNGFVILLSLMQENWDVDGAYNVLLVWMCGESQAIRDTSIFDTLTENQSGEILGHTLKAPEALVVILAMLRIASLHADTKPEAQLLVGRVTAFIDSWARGWPEFWRYFLRKDICTRLIELILTQAGLVQVTEDLSPDDTALDMDSLTLSPEAVDLERQAEMGQSIRKQLIFKLIVTALVRALGQTQTARGSVREVLDYTLNAFGGGINLEAAAAWQSALLICLLEELAACLESKSEGYAALDVITLCECSMDRMRQGLLISGEVHVLRLLTLRAKTTHKPVQDKPETPRTIAGFMSGVVSSMQKLRGPLPASPRSVANKLTWQCLKRAVLMITLQSQNPQSVKEPLRFLMDNASLIVCDHATCEGTDIEYLACLLWGSVRRFIVSDDAMLRDWATGLAKLMLLTFQQEFSSLLICTLPNGTHCDLLTQGFHQLYHKDTNMFHFWVADQIGVVEDVFNVTCGEYVQMAMAREKEGLHEQCKHFGSNNANRMSSRKRTMQVCKELSSQWGDKLYNQLMRDHADEIEASLARQAGLRSFKLSEAVWEWRLTKRREFSSAGSAPEASKCKYTQLTLEGPLRMRRMAAMQPIRSTPTLSREDRPPCTQAALESMLKNVDPGAEAEDVMPEQCYELAHDEIFGVLFRDHKISSCFNAQQLCGLRTSDGVFVLCDDAIAFATGFFLNPDGEVVENFDEEIAREDRHHSLLLWHYTSVAQLFRRRYLQRIVGLEFCFTDHETALFVFPRAIFDEVWTLVRQLPLPQLTSHAYVEDMEPDATVGQRLITYMAELTQRWQAGEVSNLAYLLRLNTLAGRSSNDLTQYPVMPWVVADWTSDVLDLSSPLSFRDLTKPIGCQNQDMEQKVRERFDEIQQEDERGVIHQFHFGTHYSSVGATLFYLIRLEPFTSDFLSFQGGRFDARRMFSSMSDTWNSCALENISDVKELTPEFFYLPEILVNANREDFGVDDSCGKLQKPDEVDLPPWSFGSPHAFVEIHREALESKFVSEHLHRWIDLIFGARQQGPEAVEAVNVFHYLTYNGATDIDAITDAVAKQATVSQLINFGQTPTQLFGQEHPVQGKLFADVVVFDPSSYEPQQLAQLGNGLAIGDIVEAKGHSVMALGRGCIALPSGAVQTFVDYGQLDRSLRIIALNSSRAVLAWSVSPHERVTCCAVAHDGRSFVTAGRDDSVWLWRIRWGGRQPRCELSKEPNALPGQTAQVTSLCICSTNAVIVGGGADGSVAVWSASALSMLWRDAVAPACGEVLAVAVSSGSGAVIAATAHVIVVWNCSGTRLAELRLSSHAPIRSLVATQQGEMLRSNMIITGHSDGALLAWRLALVCPEQPSAGRWRRLCTRMQGLPYVSRAQRTSFQLKLERRMDGHKAAVGIVRIARGDTNVFTTDMRGQSLVWALSRARHEEIFHLITDS